MKKTLVALAALAATAAFAQSTVTISGAINTGLNSNTTTLGSGVSTATTTMANSAAGTSNVTFSGVEDLGGGMKGLFLYEMDPNANFANFATPNGEVYVGISGGFGSLKLGTPNQPSLAGQANRNPYGTKQGGGFGGVMGAAKVRMNQSFRYDTPTFSGFSAALAWTPEMSTATAATVAGANPVSGAAVVAAAAAQTDIGLFYSNGPLNAGLSYNTQDSTAVGSVTIPAGAAGMRQTNYYVQYAFGAANLYFGGHNQDNISAAGVTTNQTGNNIGIKYTMGSIDLMANYAIQRMSVANTDQRLWGLGADYNFSKRTAAQTRINQQDNDTAGAAIPAAATGQVRNVYVGLIHRF